MLNEKIMGTCIPVLQNSSTTGCRSPFPLHTMVHFCQLVCFVRVQTGALRQDAKWGGTVATHTLPWCSVPSC